MVVILDDRPLSAGHLAERIGCSLPNLTGIVDRLEKLGYVERGRDPTDRRVVLIRPTTRGDAIHAAMSAVFRARLTYFLEALLPGDRELLLGLMHRIVASVRDRSKHASPDPSPDLSEESPS